VADTTAVVETTAAAAASKAVAVIRDAAAKLVVAASRLADAVAVATPTGANMQGEISNAAAKAMCRSALVLVRAAAVARDAVAGIVVNRPADANAAAVVSRRAALVAAHAVSLVGAIRVA
jgi:hypothetical protein